jgi:hypothetical protein
MENGEDQARDVRKEVDLCARVCGRVVSPTVSVNAPRRPRARARAIGRALLTEPLGRGLDRQRRPEFAALASAGCDDARAHAPLGRARYPAARVGLEQIALYDGCAPASGVRSSPHE